MKAHSVRSMPGTRERSRGVAILAHFVAALPRRLGEIGLERGRNTAQMSQQRQQLQYQSQKPQQGFGGTGPQCLKCGRPQHDHPNYCPAINQNCRCCERKGHFARVFQGGAKNGETARPKLTGSAARNRL